MRHELKTWPGFFGKVIAGIKTFEIRKNDRNFQVGDELLLKEWDPGTGTYSGRECLVAVPYIANGSALDLLSADVVVMSIQTL